MDRRKIARTLRFGQATAAATLLAGPLIPDKPVRASDCIRHDPQSVSKFFPLAENAGACFRHDALAKERPHDPGAIGADQDDE
jgi:hypothetical protein